MIEAVRPRLTSHRNYRCLFCPKIWKRYNVESIEYHLRDKHTDKIADIAETEAATIRKLQIENEELRRKLANVPKPPEKKTEYYQCILYCKNENKVFKSGMPKGVPVENVRCSSCGIVGVLTITNNNPSWFF